MGDEENVGKAIKKTGKAIKKIGKTIEKIIPPKIKLLAKILIIILICIIIVVYAVKGEDITGDRSVTYTAKEYSQNIKGTKAISGSSSNGTNGTYVNLEETTKEIVDAVNEDETNSNVLERYLGADETKQQEFIAKLLKAEYVTQYPDLRSKDEIGTKIEDPYEFQGCIQIRRASSETEGSTGNSEEQFLEYMSYDKFMELLNNNDKEALNYFTLRGTTNTENLENGEVPDQTEEEEIEIVVAVYTEKIVEITTNDDEVNFAEDFENDFQENTNLDGTKTATSTELVLDEVSKAYQSMTDTYAVTFDMLWSLLVIGEDVDFVNDLANLILNSKVIITVQDNLLVTTDTLNYTYQKQFDENIKIKIQMDGDGTKTAESTFAKNTITLPSSQKKYYKKTVKTSKVNTAIMDVTYADTWILEYNNSYNNVIHEATETLNEVYTKEDKEELKDTENIETKGYNNISYNQQYLNSIVNNYISAGAKNSVGETISVWKDRFKEENSTQENIEESDNTGIILRYLQTKKTNKVINKQEEVKNVVAYNTYTRGTPTVREKINSYSCYSTIGLDWTKHLENGTLLDYMNGESSYSESVSRFVTKDKKYYINYGEWNKKGELTTTNYAYGCKVEDFINKDAGGTQILLYAQLKGLQDTTALEYESVYNYLTSEEHNYLEVGSKAPVAAIDEVILQLYPGKRQSAYNFIEEAQDELGRKWTGSFCTGTDRKNL